MRRTFRRWRASVLVAVVCTTGWSCAGSDDSEASVAETIASTTTSVTTVPPTTAPPPPTTIVDLLGSCVDHAKFMALTGNEFWGEMWIEAGKTDAGMREVCSFLADGQDGWLEQIHDDWEVLQAAGDSTPAGTSPAPSTSTPGPPDGDDLVAGCMIWVRWYVFSGDPDVTEAWGADVRSDVRLRERCTVLVDENPALAAAMSSEAAELGLLVAERDGNGG